jgi:large subunit ribosomal protein L35
LPGFGQAIKGSRAFQERSHFCGERRLVGLSQVEHHMPKMKSKSSAKKRFRVRPGGTVKRGQAFKRHILTKKTTKNKRHLRGAVTVNETNMGHMAQMLPGMGI